MSRYLQTDNKNGSYFLANISDDLLTLAFGIRACSEGEMPKVPLAW
jgi:hypothetical protein